MGPDYQPPQPSTPSAFNDLRRTDRTASRALAAQPDPKWWRTFNDAQLDSLIDRAIAGNLSLQQAVLRIAGAREQTLQAGAAGLPTVSANASATRQQLGLKGELDSYGVRAQVAESSEELASRLDSLTRPIHLYQGSFDTSWELDLWGRVRRSVEMANAQTQASVESRNDALVSLEAEVARAYLQFLQLRGAQSVSDTLMAQIDVAQYQAQQRQAMNGLAVPVGVPASLARRRPDVREAEAQLHAATANIGVSGAQLFPDLSLTGQFEMRNTDSDYLTHWSSHFYSYGPQVSIPIFQGGRLVSNVRLARAQQANAVLAYRQTVLTALQDVENALVSYRADQQRVDGLEQTADALQNAFNLASNSYRQGISTFIEVLDAQRQLAQARQQAASARVQSSVDLVSLYKALGGGLELYPQGDLPKFQIVGPAETVNGKS
ncbi:TolC family protein [Candidatus Sodalis pierantonius]|nr:TolC family protein [Candidatus Sodalis pierantonius]